MHRLQTPAYNPLKYNFPGSPSICINRVYPKKYKNIIPAPRQR